MAKKKCNTSSNDKCHIEMMTVYTYLKPKEKVYFNGQRCCPLAQRACNAGCPEGDTLIGRKASTRAKHIEYGIEKSGKEGIGYDSNRKPCEAIWKSGGAGSSESADSGGRGILLLSLQFY